jgi:hypothetical protein
MPGRVRQDGTTHSLRVGRPPAAGGRSLGLAETSPGHPGRTRRPGAHRLVPDHRGRRLRAGEKGLPDRPQPRRPGASPARRSTSCPTGPGSRCPSRCRPRTPATPSRCSPWSGPSPRSGPAAARAAASRPSCTRTSPMTRLTCAPGSATAASPSASPAKASRPVTSSAGTGGSSNERSPG